MTDIRDKLSPLEKRALLALKDGTMKVEEIGEKIKTSLERKYF